MILLLALTAFTLRPVSVSTDFAEATANPATTTLTVATSGNAAILDITPSSTAGTFSSSDNSGTSLAFNVSTNNITGYNLGISHGSSTTPAPLTNEDLSTDLSSLPAGTSITDSDFNTSTYVGYYGYKPSKLNSQSNSNYIPAPTTNSTTLNKTTRANTASDEYTIALGANIDYTKSAGTYTNTFILTAVANNVAYTISYKDNTSDSSVSNLPATESASAATASSFKLSSTIPTRTGYTFNKWCDGTVTHNATGNDTCSGTTYSAGSTYSFASPSSTSTNVANLYAMWNAIKTYSLAVTFAGTDTKTSATANVNQSTGVASSTYANNLATKDTVTVPGASELTIELNYSMEQNYDYLYIFKGTYTGDVSKNMSAGQLYTYNTPSGSSGQYATYNTTTITVPGDTVTFAFYSDGSAAYYGYYAKVTGKSSVSSVKVCKTAGNCSGSDLMGTVSTSGSSVSGLAYNTAYYLYPTFISNNYELNSWSKTSSYGTLSSTTTTNPTFTMGAGNGAVTITGKSSYTGYYMQEFTAPLCSSLASSSNYTVRDMRDNQDYTVRYFNGNCWMTQNLRFSGRSIDATNTNINTSKTISWGDLTSGNSLTDARYHNSGNTTNGYWYNYAGASAMTITGSDNSTNATYDICPKNWRLPTNSEFYGIIGYSTAFSPVAGGYYDSGSLGSAGLGYWWSATANDYFSESRYYLRWDGSSLNNGSTANRNNGYYVRCVLQGQQQTGGCFTAGSQVQVSLDGQTKNIEDVRIGDEIVSYDPDQKEYYMTEVLGTIVHDGAERSTRLVELTLDDNTKLNMTENHPILTKEGYKAISEANYPELTSSDIVITTSGEHSIRSIRIYDTEPTVVYNLTVKGRDEENGPTHSYIVNGVVVHNVTTGGQT